MASSARHRLPQPACMPQSQRRSDCTSSTTTSRQCALPSSSVLCLSLGVLGCCGTRPRRPGCGRICTELSRPPLAASPIRRGRLGRTRPWVTRSTSKRTFGTCACGSWRSSIACATPLPRSTRRSSVRCTWASATSMYGCHGSRMCSARANCRCKGSERRPRRTCRSQSTRSLWRSSALKAGWAACPRWHARPTWMHRRSCTGSPHSRPIRSRPRMTFRIGGSQRRSSISRQ